MNFWRASILPLILAAAAFLGVCAPNVEAHLEECAFEHMEAATPTWFGWSPTLQEAPEDDASLEAPDSKENSFSHPRKRNRKCWRPERSVTVELVPLKSPAEASRPDFLVREYTTPSPAGSDLLFIVGGYTRLFQKG